MGERSLDLAQTTHKSGSFTIHTDTRPTVAIVTAIW